MSRSMTSSALQALLSLESGEVVVWLFHLSAPGWTGDIYLVNHPYSITSNGDVYQPYGVDFVLPKEDTSQLAPQTKLSICNVDRNVLDIFRSTIGKTVTVEISLVREQAPDELIYNAKYKLIGAPYDEGTIEGVLAFNQIMNEPIPCWTYCPSHYPAQFGDQ